MYQFNKYYYNNESEFDDKTNLMSTKKYANSILNMIKIIYND